MEKQHILSGFEFNIDEEVNSKMFFVSLKYHDQILKSLTLKIVDGQIIFNDQGKIYQAFGYKLSNLLIGVNTEKMIDVIFEELISRYDVLELDPQQNSISIAFSTDDEQIIRHDMRSCFLSYASFLHVLQAEVFDLINDVITSKWEGTACQFLR